jgi:hypothetical protein
MVVPPEFFAGAIGGQSAHLQGRTINQTTVADRITMATHKVGRNQLCPCGKLKKYKECCLGKVDWEAIYRHEGNGFIRHLSTRGKNKLFVDLILDALQIDTDKGPIDHPDFKRSFTSAAVAKIYRAVQLVWPDGDDLKRVLRGESEYTSGLYIGQYDADLVRRGVTRHSLYADRILLIDPLLHPKRIREEFNPLVHPEQHRTATLQWISLWFSLLPWIEEGIVGFVRAPGDFYPNLEWDGIRATEARYERHPDLRKLLRTEVEGYTSTEQYQSFREHIFLSTPDSQLRAWMLEDTPDLTEQAIGAALGDIARRREAHPYFLHPERPGLPWSELWQTSTGTNYEGAKLIAFHSDSYVMTDIRARWREIELDRSDAGARDDRWEPFAKAFQGLRFNFLDAVPLDAALAIRRDGRLEPMRHFLQKVWSASSQPRQFDEGNITVLAAELNERVREAEVEWRKIDRDLVKMVTATASATLLAAGPLVSSGQAAWLGAAAVAAGIGAVASSTMKRKEYRLQYPAGFFVDLQKGRYE